MTRWISPNRKSDGQDSLSLDEKIEVFRDRVEGWQLDIAQKVWDDVPHSGFAVLAIVSSYFEMIAQFRSGLSSDRQSKKFFSDGFKELYPSDLTGSTADEVKESDIDLIYRRVRCGLYHDGQTRVNVLISNDFLQARRWRRAKGPAVMVVRERPVARDTRVTPPHP